MLVLPLQPLTGKPQHQNIPLSALLWDETLCHTCRSLHGADGEEVENHHLVGAPDLDQPFLAVKAANTGLVVVLEEAVRAGTVDVDVG